MTYLLYIIVLLLVFVEIFAMLKYIKSVKKMSILVCDYEKLNDLTDKDIKLMQNMMKAVYGPHKVWWNALSLPWRLLHYKPNKSVQADIKSLHNRHSEMFTEFQNEWHKALFFASPTVWIITVLQTACIIFFLMLAVVFLWNVQIIIQKIKQISRSLSDQIFIKC